VKKIRKRKELRIRPEPTPRPGISICMVVKNEEELLPDSLKGVSELADEIVVVDTGSSDRTVEIAKRFGAKVAQHPWNDDFSEVRNASLQLATGDWIMILDADERVHYRDFRSIQLTIESRKADAYRMLTRNYANLPHAAGWNACVGDYPDMENGFSGWYPTIKVRLFKRSQDIRFVGCVHELVEPSLIQAGKIIGNSSIPIHHYSAWDARAEREKGGSYLRLGRKKVVQQPDDPRAHFELGVQYLTLGKHEEAEAMLRKSVQLYEITPAAKLAATYYYPPEALNMLGVALERLGRTQEALSHYRKAVSMDSRYVASLVNWGLLLEKYGNISEAHEKLQTALHIDPENSALRTHLERINRSIAAESAPLPY